MNSYPCKCSNPAWVEVKGKYKCIVCYKGIDRYRREHGQIPGVKIYAGQGEGKPQAQR